MMESQDFVVDLFYKYLGGDDFAVKNNANFQRSVSALNLHLCESVTKEYCLNNVYSKDKAEFLTFGDLFIFMT